MSKENRDSSKEKQQAEKGTRIEEMLEEERRRSEELLTKMRYLQADFENYRKRMEKELQEAEEMSVRGLADRLLNVVDELELAVANSEKPEQGRAVSEGIKMIYKNLISALRSTGLKRIEPVGMPFDPKLHDAVEKVQGSSESDVVAKEIRGGYTFRGQVLRPSMVKVELASKKADGQEEKENE